MTNRVLSDAQIESFGVDGFLVLPGFVDAAMCTTLRTRALELAEQLAPTPDEATVFTADGTGEHAQDT